MMEAICSSEISVLTRASRRHIQGHGILVCFDSSNYFFASSGHSDLPHFSLSLSLSLSLSDMFQHLTERTQFIPQGHTKPLPAIKLDSTCRKLVPSGSCNARLPSEVTETLLQARLMPVMLQFIAEALPAIQHASTGRHTSSFQMTFLQRAHIHWILKCYTKLVYNNRLETLAILVLFYICVPTACAWNVCWEIIVFLLSSSSGRLSVRFVQAYL
jgi:hypothetical protein